MSGPLRSLPRLAFWFLFLFFPALALCPAPVKASDRQPLAVDGSFTSGDLAPYMDFVLDPGGAWSAEQAARARDWRPLSGFTLKKDQLRGVTWFRLNVAAAPGAPALYLEVCTHQPKDAAVFAPLADPPGGWLRLETGWGAGEKNSELGFINTVVSLPRNLDPGRPLLIRWEDPFITEPRPILFGEEAFRQMAWDTLALKFTVYGVMLAMILYNLALSLFLRDRAYFMYVLYMAAMLLYQATVRGEIKFLSLPAYQALYSRVLLLSTASAVLGLQFARTFLATRKNLPRLDKVLIYLMGSFLVLVAGVDLAGFKAQANTASFLILPFMIVSVLGAAVLRIRQGFGSALYFLLAWTILSLGVLVYLLYGLGYLPPWLPVVHAAGLGAAAESVLLSLALADRIRRLQADREALLARQHGLARQAITDELTGLFNKRFLQSALKDAVRRADQDGRPLSVVLLDVDHFKQFNDTHGHPKGDEVLAAVGRDIRGSVRDGDLGCRYGGEEFVIILPHTGPAEGLAVAERVRLALANRRFEVGPDQWAGVTVSAGVACLRPGEDGAEFLNRADQALYAAKQAGRDRSVAGD